MQLESARISVFTVKAKQEFNGKAKNIFDEDLNVEMHVSKLCTESMSATLASDWAMGSPRGTLGKKQDQEKHRHCRRAGVCDLRESCGAAGRLFLS